MLYRAQSKHRLNGAVGILPNPNISRPRRPRDISQELHVRLQGWFSTKFGVDYRSQALFCTGDLDVAKGYARSHQAAVIALTPAEPYSLCFSPICKDLYGHFQFLSARNPNYLTTLDDELEKLNYVHRVDCGLEEAAATGNEVMVFSQSFSYSLISE